MATALTYRRATAADVPAMCETAAEGFAGYAEFAPPRWRPPVDVSDTARLRARLSMPRAVAIVAQRGPEPAGHVLLIPASESRDAADDPQLAHIMHVFVRRPHWGTGVASELLRLLLEGARAEGFSRARLFTPAEQLRARRFYEREGWELARGPWLDEDLEFGVVEYRRDPL